MQARSDKNVFRPKIEEMEDYPRDNTSNTGYQPYPTYQMNS